MVILLSKFCAEVFNAYLTPFDDDSRGHRETIEYIYPPLLKIKVDLLVKKIRFDWKNERYWVMGSNKP